MSDLLDINHRLLRLYGRDTIYNQPNYRVVWSEHLTEKREGEYEDVTESGIYLGTKKGIREVPKYWYLTPCWVLEKFHLVFERGVYDEVKEPYMYEPLYVFLDKDNNSLPLYWKPIELIIQSYLNAEKVYRDFQAEDEKKKQEETNKIRDILEEEDPKWQPTFKSSVQVGEKL